MKAGFIRCEFCKVEVPQEACKLAAYRTVISGKEYVFCCPKCAERYQQKKKK
jgi:YHS domain-containing protein